jgi:hypothetical protein
MQLSRMRDSPPLRDDVMRAGVWPTVVALLVTGVLVIERFQTDHAVTCGWLGKSAGPACEMSGLLVWLLPPISFAIAHCLGASALAQVPLSRRDRIARGAKVLGFSALHLLPLPGLFMFGIGAGVGFAFGITIILLVFAPVAGALAAGAASGTLLGLASGPPRATLTRPEWSTLLKRYAAASAAAALLVTSSVVLVDLNFYGWPGVGQPGLSAAVLLSATGAGSILVWCAALQVYWRSGSVLQSMPVQRGLGIIAVAALVLTGSSWVMIRSSIPVFGTGDTLFTPIAAYLRGGRPLLSEPVTFAGLRYTGDRATVVRRDRSYAEPVGNETLRLHLADVRAAGRSVDIELVAKAVVEPLILDCQPPEGREITCATSTGGARLEMPQGSSQSRQVVSLYSAVFTFDIDQPDVMRSAGVTRVPDVPVTHPDGTENPAAWRLGPCALDLLAVTEARVSVSRPIACDADWRAEAPRLRRQIAQLFAKP